MVEERVSRSELWYYDVPLHSGAVSVAAGYVRRLRANTTAANFGRTESTGPARGPPTSAPLSSAAPPQSTSGTPGVHLLYCSKGTGGSRGPRGRSITATRPDKCPKPGSQYVAALATICEHSTAHESRREDRHEF